MKEKTIKVIIEILTECYPDAKCALNFSSPFELLIATILSAQCTDVRVNKVSTELFKIADTPEKMKALGKNKLSEIIKSCGLVNNKSQNIISSSEILISKFNSTVPDTMEELTSLPGVGRKTANVVLSNAFGIDAIAVDTHVFRVANRIGLAKADNVSKTELMLMESIPKRLWSISHHLLILHGRNVCSSRNPKCDICKINTYCEKNL